MNSRIKNNHISFMFINNYKIIQKKFKKKQWCSKSKFNQIYNSIIIA